jgi:5-methylcytosine-specific restriction endonuclease McrA
MKTCTKCKKLKSLERFSKRRPPRNHDHYSYCKDCAREAGRLYREANREVINEKARDHRKDNAADLTRYARTRKFGLLGDEAFWLDVLDGDPCAYCGERFASAVDHIVPSSEGGEDGWGNLTGACKSCNSQKRTRSLLLFLAQRNGCYEWRQDQVPNSEILRSAS